ncbi:hypothetical protein [Pantoea dispersa]|uniref:hypothetical protein n=1 Tax=Pantoea dispersa TaxID=59814 RepID=UPI00241D9409|nr:hypothetical protein [Pantoea dispersa]
MRENQEKAVAYIDFMAAQIKSEPGDIYRNEIRISQEMKGYNPGLNKAYSDNTLISRHLFSATPVKSGWVIILPLNNKQR